MTSCMMARWINDKHGTTSLNVNIDGADALSLMSLIWIPAQTDWTFTWKRLLGLMGLDIFSWKWYPLNRLDDRFKWAHKWVEFDPSCCLCSSDGSWFMDFEMSRVSQLWPGELSQHFLYLDLLLIQIVLLLVDQSGLLIGSLNLLDIGQPSASIFLCLRLY